MPITTHAFILMDKNGAIIGRIVSAGLTPRVQGAFIPTIEFSKYESVFSKLAHAANNMLFTHADEIQTKIDRMDFYVIRDDQNAAKLKVKGLQVMEGEAIFELQQPLNLSPTPTS